MASPWRIVTGTLALLGLSVLGGGCAADPKPGVAIVGTWTGAYRWDHGSAYPVTLVIPDRSLSGKVSVAFAGTESAGACSLVHVKGTLHVPSRKVVLDEVDTECGSFLLDGLYEGRLSVDGQSMDLVWGLDDGSSTDDGSAGTLSLTKVSDETLSAETEVPAFQVPATGA